MPSLAERAGVDLPGNENNWALRGGRARRPPAGSHGLNVAAVYSRSESVSDSDSDASSESDSDSKPEPEERPATCGKLRGEPDALLRRKHPNQSLLHQGATDAACR